MPSTTSPTVFPTFALSPSRAATTSCHLVRAGGACGHLRPPQLLAQLVTVRISWPEYLG